MTEPLSVTPATLSILPGDSTVEEESIRTQVLLPRWVLAAV